MRKNDDTTKNEKTNAKHLSSISDNITEVSTTDRQFKFPIWAQGGLMSPWEATKRAELILGGKEESKLKLETPKDD